MFKIRKTNIILFVLFSIVYLFRLQANQLSELNPNKKYIIKGRVSSINKVSDYKWRLKISQIWVESSNFDYFRKLQIGDEAEAVGAVEKRVTNRFYSQFWLVDPEIRVIQGLTNRKFDISGTYWGFLRKIDNFRLFLEKIYTKNLPEPESSLLSGIVLGSKKQLSKEFYDALRQSGTLHIIVASGMNVMILGKVILNLLLKTLKRNQAIFVTLVCILIYTLLAGGEPPIVRAAMMGSVAFIAQALGREYWAGWALFLSAGLMLLVSPELLFQVGFQLSVAATGGLIFLSPSVSSWLDKACKGVSLFKVDNSNFTRILLTKYGVGIVKTELTETIAAQIAVMPLLLAHFGQFNLLSAVPNLLIGALVPILMKLGGILLLFGSLWQGLGQIFAYILWPILKYIVIVIELFGKTDFLTISWRWPWWLSLVWWGGVYFLAKSEKSCSSSRF